MTNRICIRHISVDPDIDDLFADDRPFGDATEILTYWSGESAPAERRFDVRLLWSNAALYVRFDARQHEPLVVNRAPDLGRKTMGLWERDVCEIFIAPDRDRPAKYFEFEIAPTGEWVDLAIEVRADGRITDAEYSSGIEPKAVILESKVIEIIKIPFSSLGGSPSAGDVWLGNLFRCVGSGPQRGYLAWRPTRTATPNFHVPSVFGEFEFVD